jgi:hypothetical protein
MAKANNEKKGVSKERVEQFKMLYPMLDGILNEMRELSKKKQDGVLNKLKAKTINRILEKIKALLHEEPSIEFLELLDEDTLPTNSDAVLMIVQFKSAMEGYQKKNQKYEGGIYKWIISE